MKLKAEEALELNQLIELTQRQILEIKQLKQGNTALFKQFNKETSVSKLSGSENNSIVNTNSSDQQKRNDQCYEISNKSLRELHEERINRQKRLKQTVEDITTSDQKSESYTS